jgi:hypothetical protein
MSEALARDISDLGPDLAAWDAVARGHALAAAVHAADISNVARPWQMSVKWGSLVSAGAGARARARAGRARGPGFPR